MKKRILGIALAGTLAFSAIAGSVMIASAELAPPNPNRLDVYTPSTGVKTYNLNCALPGAWTGAEGSDARTTWEKYGSTSGLYWWGSMDNPDEAPAAASHGWPGWKMKKGDQVNLYTSLVPEKTASMIFSNFIDGGMDTKYPEYNAAKQTKDLTQLEYFGMGDSDYYSKEFWDYLYDTYYDDFVDDPNFQIPEFGPYAKNFFYSKDDDSIYHYINDMVFVVDTVNTDRAQVSPVSGMAGLDGGFYFYYGNGEFGIWPTKELCIEKEGLKVDDQGNVLLDQETVQEKTDFVTRERTDAYDLTTKKDVVVFGNFTGKYWTDNSEVIVPTEPEPSTSTTTPSGDTDPSGSGSATPDSGDKDATNPSGSSQNSTDPSGNNGDDSSIPDPDGGDAGSSSSDSGSSGSSSSGDNGAIQTGGFAVPVLLSTLLIAGLGVFYFVRKRRSSK